MQDSWLCILRVFKGLHIGGCGNWQRVEFLHESGKGIFNLLNKLIKQIKSYVMCMPQKDSMSSEWVFVCKFIVLGAI